MLDKYKYGLISCQKDGVIIIDNKQNYKHHNKHNILQDLYNYRPTHKLLNIRQLNQASELVYYLKQINKTHQQWPPT